MSFDVPPPPTASAAPTRQRPSPRRRGALLLTIAILVVLFFAFTLFASYYTDWLWYKSVGITSVYSTQLWVRLALFVGFFAIAFAAIVLNAFFAYRFRPIFRAISLEQQSLDDTDLALDPFRRILLIGFGASSGSSSVRGHVGVADGSGVDEQHGIRSDRLRSSTSTSRSMCSRCLGGGFSVDTAMILVIL